MGDIRIQYEWQVEVPQPRSTLAEFAADADPAAAVKDSSSSCYAFPCPLRQPQAFDWIPSIAILGDAGLEVAGVVVSLLDIVSVRISPQLSKWSRKGALGQSPLDFCGESVETEASERAESPSEGDNAASAATAGAAGRSSSASATAAEKENVLWVGEEKDPHQQLIVLLRSPLPTATADPPLYHPPADAGADVGSCLIMRASTAGPCMASPVCRSSLLLQSGSEGGAAEADSAMGLLQRLQQFITLVRPIFCSLRKRAALTEDIRARFRQQQEQQQQHEVVAAAAVEVERLRANKQLHSLLGGFLLRDCAALEEAVAYAPLAVYAHLGAATTLLPQLPVEPSLYPTWKRVMLQQRRLHLAQQQSPRSVSPVCSLRASRSSIGAGVVGAAAASSGPPAAVPFQLLGGGCRLAKGSHSCCEDAFFCLEKEGCFGVFDGVGSWAVEGIDASRFSEGLAAAAAAEAAAHLSPNNVSPLYLPLDANGRARLLLQRAHEAICNSPDKRWGSSTAAIGCIDRKTGRLGVACLGDSVLMVLRRQMLPSSMSFYAADIPSIKPETLLASSSSSSSRFPRLLRRCCWRTKEQRWENGAPYQLCNLPARNEWAALQQQGYDRFVSVLERIDPQGDTADMAFAPPQPLLLQPGDLLLAFSDGVGDNLFDREIEVFCSLAVSPDEAALLKQQQKKEQGQQQQQQQQEQEQQQQQGQEQQQQPPQIGFTLAQDVAELIVKIAKRRSADGLFERPFVAAPEGTRAVPAHLAGGEGEGPRGGKRDDISCVALWVTATAPAHGTSLPTEAVPATGTAAAVSPVQPPSRTEGSIPRIAAAEPRGRAAAAVAAPGVAAAEKTAVATPDSLRKPSGADRTPTRTCRFRQTTPGASPSTPLSPSTPAATAESPSQRGPARGGTPGARTPSSSRTNSNRGPMSFLEACGPSRLKGFRDLRGAGSPTSTPRKPLSAAAGAAVASSAGAQAAVEAGESRLPRPNFAAFAVLRAAAAAVRERTSAGQRQGSPNQRTCRGISRTVGSPGPRYSDTPKKPIKRSNILAALPSAGTAAPEAPPISTAGALGPLVQEGAPSATSKQIESSAQLHKRLPAATTATKPEKAPTAATVSDRAAAASAPCAASSPRLRSLPAAGSSCSTQEALKPQQQPQQGEQKEEPLSASPPSKITDQGSQQNTNKGSITGLAATRRRVSPPTPKTAASLRTSSQNGKTAAAGTASPGAAKRPRPAEKHQRRTMQRTGASS